WDEIRCCPVHLQCCFCFCPDNSNMGMAPVFYVVAMQAQVVEKAVDAICTRERKPCEFAGPFADFRSSSFLHTVYGQHISNQSLPTQVFNFLLEGNGLIHFSRNEDFLMLQSHRFYSCSSALARMISSAPFSIKASAVLSAALIGSSFLSICS